MDAKISTIDRELDFLFGRINYEKTTARRFSFKSRAMSLLMQRLGEPQRTLPTIHIAGTKGKGSVSAFIGNCLWAAGLRAGVYSSPHIESIHERFVINAQPISNEALASVLADIRTAVEAIDEQLQDEDEYRLPTFFEMATATALLHFARQTTDWAILETGLGGRLDSTNICQPAACVITNISLDHTRQLGNTLDKIAGEKAGIIKPNVPVICGVRADLARDVIHQVAEQNHARIFQLGQDFDYEYQGTLRVFGSIDGKEFSIDGVTPGMLGQHQAENAAVALATLQLEIFQNRFTLDQLQSGIANARLKGRCELIETSVSRQAVSVLLDMAHNEASANALAEMLSQLQQTGNFASSTLIFAVSKDKDIPKITRRLFHKFDRVIVTRFQTNPRAANPQSIADTVPHPDLRIEDQPELAWQSAIQSVDSPELICVAGSAFLCSELRPLVTRIFPANSPPA